MGVAIRKQVIETVKELAPPVILYGVMRLAERIVRVYPDLKPHAQSLIHLWAITEWIAQMNSKKPASLVVSIGSLLRASNLILSYPSHFGGQLISQ